MHRGGCRTVWLTCTNPNGLAKRRWTRWRRWEKCSKNKIKLKKKHLHFENNCCCSASSSGPPLPPPTNTFSSPPLHAPLLPPRQEMIEKEMDIILEVKAQTGVPPPPRGPLWHHRGSFFLHPPKLSEQAKNERMGSTVQLCVGDTRQTQSFFYFLLLLLSLWFLLAGLDHRWVES